MAKLTADDFALAKTLKTEIELMNRDGKRITCFMNHSTGMILYKIYQNEELVPIGTAKSLKEVIFLFDNLA